MLYLFNSGYRALYRTNVLNTLCLPDESTNEYRHRHAGDPRYVSPASLAEVKRLKPGTQCVVIFIDRFGPGEYVYHPLRLGSFVQYADINEQLYCTIKLQSFIYPREVTQFSRLIARELASHGIPAMTGNDPENRHDGNYVVIADSLFENKADFDTGETAWARAVDSLSTTRAFTTTDTEEPLFLRFALKRGNSDKILKPKLHSGQSRYDLSRNTSYRLVLTYKFPKQRLDPGAIRFLKAEFSDNLRKMGSDVLTIDSAANRVELPFASKKVLEEPLAHINLSPSANQAQGTSLLTATVSPQFAITEPKWFWVQMLTAILLLSLTAALTGTDITSIQPFTWRGLAHVIWPKAVFGVPHTVALFWLFYLVGKKVL